MNKKDAKRVYNRIFQGTFKKGDFLKFAKGKVIWQISYKTAEGFYIYSLNFGGWAGKYIYPRDFNRVYRLDEEEVLKWILRETPSRLRHVFNDIKKLKRMLRKFIPTPNL